MDADPARPFPNPDQGTRVVLYPLAAGGVALEWHLSPALIKGALDAFPGRDAVAKIYLRRTDGAGAPLAVAALDDQWAITGTGRARFERPILGGLLAEVGLEGRRDGAWLLLARSNQLEAAPPPDAITVASAPESPPRPDPAAEAAQAREPAPQATPASEFRHRSPGPVPMPTPPPLQPDSSSAEARRSWLDPGAQAGAPPPEPSRFPDLSLMSRADSPRPLVRRFPMAAGANSSSGDRSEAPPEASVQAVAARSEGTIVAIGLTVAESPAVAGPETGGAETVPAVRAHPSEQGRATEPPTMDPQPPNRQDAIQPRLSPYGGSGPLAPYPARDSVSIHGELRIFGSAAPGSLLDLGGHPFRVGRGGRFAFSVDVDDPELLAALLSRLPRIPVAERDP